MEGLCLRPPTTIVVLDDRDLGGTAVVIGGIELESTGEHVDRDGHVPVPVARIRQTRRIDRRALVAEDGLLVNEEREPCAVRDHLVDLLESVSAEVPLGHRPRLQNGSSEGVLSKHHKTTLLVDHHVLLWIEQVEREVIQGLLNQPRGVLAEMKDLRKVRVKPELHDLAVEFGDERIMSAQLGFCSSNRSSATQNL